MEIGIITNITSFQNLNETDTNTGWSVSGGKLVSPADITKPIQFSHVSGLWMWNRKIISDKKTLKLFFYNTAGNFTTDFYINDQNKLCSHFSYDNTTRTSTDILGYTSGDLLEFSIIKNGRTITFSVKNLNTNQIVNLNASNVAISIHKLRLITSEVTEISTYKFESSQTTGGTLVVGDSITYGSNATAENLSWVSIANWERDCGPGDKSPDALLLIPEILNFIKPIRVVYAMGTNDTIIDNWKNALVQYGKVMNANRITFIPVCPYANTSRSMQAYYDHIIANYSIFFDFYTTTKVASGTNLKPEYNSGDNVHLNNAGHAAVGNFILSSPYYEYYKNFEDNTLELYLSYRFK